MTASAAGATTCVTAAVGARAAVPPRSTEEPAGVAPLEEAAERAEFPDVVGWQPLILNQPKSCADCEEPIERSERGFAGVTAAGLSEIYLCRDCMDARR